MPRPSKSRKPTYRLPGLSKPIRLSAKTMDVLGKRLVAFRKRFGRDPEPGDPVFFDPEADMATEISPHKSHRIWGAIVQVAAEAGTDPAYIYAMQKTGRVLVKQNQHWLSKEERQAWHDAIKEYDRKFPFGTVL